ncbi:MAG: hypothetical protein LBC74_15045 [Planctomycetaceae bacterium]|jgi:hypothetical protein|nr:hypothetical protein [Planctomycetaceae bacterium]
MNEIKNHGLRQMNTDKCSNIINELGVELSSSLIGQHVGVDYKIIFVVRRRLEMTWEIPQSNFRTGFDNRKINTPRISLFYPTQ